MVTEIATLTIKTGDSSAFEAAFSKAQLLISSTEGYIKHELLKCMEKEDNYVLLVHWQKLEDHTEGFRKSVDYKEWKQLLHHFYHPFPTVYHYYNIF